jgi:hypothetical protein
MEVSGQFDATTHFNPWERAPDNSGIGDWFSLITSLDTEEKKNFLPLPRMELQPAVRRNTD